MVFNMCDNLVDVDAHQFKNQVVDHRNNDVNGQLFDLNVEHGDERPDQRLDMCVLLHEQKRPPLQDGECDVDQVDGERDRIGDNPPLVRYQRLGIVLLGVVDQLASILLVECEQAPEVDPTIGLFWAFQVHANDEDVLHAQIDHKRVGELDRTTSVDALGRGLDDNVNLIRCAPDPQNLVFSTRNNASHDTNMPACHGVIAISQHAYQLCAPLAIQCVHKLSDHIEDIKRRMSLKH
jgi:hypothetical protein